MINWSAWDQDKFYNRIVRNLKENNYDAEYYLDSEVNLIGVLLDIIDYKDSQIKGGMELNRNLKRISGDRARKALNIKQSNGSDRTGLFLLSERNRSFEIPKSSGQYKNLYLNHWRTSLDYSATEKAAKAFVFEFFKRTKFKVYDKCLSEMNSSVILSNSPVAFNFEYIQNYNSEYWEVSFLSNMRINLNRKEI